jgi:hypothetical protein
MTVIVPYLIFNSIIRQSVLQPIVSELILEVINQNYYFQL